MTDAAAAFAAAMGRLGPWDAARRVAVAVSGGPDSLALAVLAQQWGDPAAFIVDHGLRAESAVEAEAARAALAALGMIAQVIRIRLDRGPGLAARARTARYAALAAACRAAGLVDLLLGHHAGDQAETVLMRERRGSGRTGLAGMAAVVETDDVRLLRPLLAFDPAALRAIVADAGLVPADDPTNTDPHATRAQLRREIGEARGPLLAAAARHGAARAAAEAAVARELASRATIFPEGYAVVSPGPIDAAALAAVLRSVSGRRYPIDAASLAAAPRAATLGGVRVQPAGRAGDGWLLTREVSAVEANRVATPATVWDGRFRVVACASGCDVGRFEASRLPTGEAGSRGASPCLPAAVRQTLPAFSGDGVLLSVPHLRYGSSQFRVSNACLPASGAPFLPG